MATKIPNISILHSYDWDAWLDGDAWLLVRGDDFNCAVESMRQQAHAAAARRGKRVRTHRKNADTIVIKAYPEERR